MTRIAKLILWLGILGLLPLFASCGHQPTERRPGLPLIASPISRGNSPPVSPSDLAAGFPKSWLRGDIGEKGAPDLEEVIRTVALMDEPGQMDPSAYPELLVELNGGIRHWLNFFSKRNGSFAGYLKRGMAHREMVEKTLAENGVPREFYYLAMIESGFANHVVSSARAAGVWQFIRPTAIRYGLRCNSYVDERKDVTRATQAAARYLRDLHRDLGSWYLVLAAYNAGGNRIERAIRRGKSRSFWKLAQDEALPRETLQFVPKFLAAVLIGNNPGKYGFAEPKETPLHPRGLARVRIPPAIGFRQIALVAHVSEAEVRRLNPQLLRGMTPPRGKSYPIWIPKESAPYLSRMWPSVAASYLPDNPS